MSLWVVSPASTSTLIVNRVDVLSRDPTVLYTLKKPVNSWTEIKIPADNIDYYTYFEIQGAVKISANQGIAIDDIIFTDKPCKY